MIETFSTWFFSARLLAFKVWWKFRSIIISLYEKCFKNDYFQISSPMIIRAIFPLLEAKGNITPRFTSFYAPSMHMACEHRIQYEKGIYSKKSKSGEAKLWMCTISPRWSSKIRKHDNSYFNIYNLFSRVSMFNLHYK